MIALSNRVHNFGAGPAALPEPVLCKAQAELLNFRNAGMSVLEISHRDARFEAVQTGAQQLLRDLLGIPDEYEILFLQGGASLQFSMLPMNFLHAGETAGYVLTGSFAEKAYAEAGLLGQTKVVASTCDERYVRIPTVDELSAREVDAYVHLTSNNTIYGTQWKSFPDFGAIPLAADMSSDILSRQIDVRQFSLIYAGAQKNLGPAGVTVVIVKKAWLELTNERIPTMLRYGVHAKHQSRYNTPPTFSIYMLYLVLEWVAEQGGVGAIEQRNRDKSNLLYDAIDSHSAFYEGHAAKDSRSMMNVTFRLPTPELTNQFLAEAKAEQLVGLGGHRSVGGCRASLYNAICLESCERLVGFMDAFCRKHS